jgi:hypothetical protein
MHCKPGHKSNASPYLIYLFIKKKSIYPTASFLSLSLSAAQDASRAAPAARTLIGLGLGLGLG